jgi:hypothetical protein
MNMKILIFFFLLINTINGVTTMNYINPNSVGKSFANEIDERFSEVQITFENPVKKPPDIMLLIEFLELHYDRMPETNGYRYCVGNQGKVVYDLSMLENFRYSCCIPISDNNATLTKLYSCPIPSAKINTDPFRTVVMEDYNQVLYKTVDSESEWKDSNLKFTYKDILSIEGVIKKVIIISFVTTLCIVACSSLMGTINLGSNEYPLTTTILHILSVITGLILQLFILQKNSEDTTIRGKYMRSGLIFSTITLSYSLFLIYIPHKKSSEDPTSKEQRITITDESKLSKIVLFFKSRRIRNFTSTIFGFLTLCQIWSINALVEAFKEYFDAEWEVLICVVIWYSILSLIYLVAFLTAIYEVKVPVKFDEKTGEMLHVVPETRYRKEVNALRCSGTVNPDVCNDKNHLAGILKENKFLAQLNYDQLNVGDLVAIDDDYANSGNPYTFLFWKIGNLHRGNIILEKSVVTEKIIKGVIKKKYGNIELINREKTKNQIKVYKVVNIDNSKEHKFVEFGEIKGGYLYQEHDILLHSIAFFLKIIPDYTPDYNYNVVENLRTEMHILTKNMGSSYGIIYWIALLTLSLTLFIYLSIFDLDVLSLLLIVIITFFSISVNIRVIHKPRIRRQKNYRNMKITFPKIKTRSVTKKKENKYYVDRKWLSSLEYCKIQNNFQIIPEFQLKHIYFTTEMINNRYYRIQYPRNCNLLSVGDISLIDSENFTKNLHTGICLFPLENKFVVKGNTGNNTGDINKDISELGIGILNNRMFIVINTNIYWIKYTNSKIHIYYCLDSDIDIFKSNSIAKIKMDINYIPANISGNTPSNILELVLPSFKSVDRITAKSESKWEYPFKIGMLLEDHKVFWNMDYPEISIENPRNIPLKSFNYKNKRNGLVLYICNTNFNVEKEFKECTFEIEITEKNMLPEFMAIGLVEEKYLYMDNFINVIPGQKNCSSIAFHSDDGSINVSNSQIVKSVEDPEIIWYNKEKYKNKIRITVGFDGFYLYFIDNKGNKITSNKNIELLESWKKGKNFAPVLYIHGEYTSKIRLKINI